MPDEAIDAAAVEAAKAKAEAEAAAAKAKADAEAAAAKAAAAVESGEVTEDEASEWLNGQFAAIKKQTEDLESRMQQRLETAMEGLRSFFRESLEQTRTLPTPPKSSEATIPQVTDPASGAGGAPAAPNVPLPTKRRARII